MQQEQIFELLTEEYTLVLARTQDDYDRVKALRNEVFSSKYDMSSKKLESIGFIFNRDDRQSFIYLVKHLSSDQYVGTVRAFFINHNTPIQKLPMQKDGNVQHINSQYKYLPIVEISRAALIKQLPKHEKYSALQLRTMLTFGLMIATRINFFLYHYNKIFTFIESSMYRIFKRHHVNFEQISQPVDSYGIRIPYAVERTKLLQETEETMGRLTRHYLKKLCHDPEPFWKFIDQNPYLERSDIELERICQLFETYGDDVDLSLLLGEGSSETTA